MSERNSAGERFSLYPVFCEAARCGSISGAAKRLYVSQPAVSNAVAQLEASLGVKLFNRSSRGITLTEEGYRYGRAVLKRHEMLFKFLHKALGIPEDVADEEACLMEHAISDSSLEKWFAFIDKLDLD